ncbi:hypothetical protein D3C80_1779690 [compost metagenome]
MYNEKQRLNQLIKSSQGEPFASDKYGPVSQDTLCSFLQEHKFCISLNDIEFKKSHSVFLDGLPFIQDVFHISKLDITVKIRCEFIFQWQFYFENN